MLWHFATGRAELELTSPIFQHLRLRLRPHPLRNDALNLLRYILEGAKIKMLYEIFVVLNAKERFFPAAFKKA